MGRGARQFPGVGSGFWGSPPGICALLVRAGLRAEQLVLVLAGEER